MASASTALIAGMGAPAIALTCSRTMAVNASEASEIDTSGLTDSSQSRGITKYRARSTPV